MCARVLCCVILRWCLVRQIVKKIRVGMRVVRDVIRCDEM